MSQTDLSEKQWRLLAPHLPPHPSCVHVYCAPVVEGSNVTREKVTQLLNERSLAARGGR
jgi:transposase